MDWQVLTGSRLADAAAGGLIVLAAGSLAARLCRQPVRRARLIVLSLLGAMAVPALGALPVAPRWSVGLPAAPAAILARADHAAPAEAGSRLHPQRATESRVALGPIEQPGGMPTDDARTGPALAPSGPVASATAARWHLPSARTVLLGSYVAVAAGFAVWWLVGQLLLWRVTRSARPVPGAIRDVFLGLAGPGGGRVAAARKRPDRLAVHLHLAPSRDPAALERCVTGASPGPSGTSWRTSGRTSRGATPGRGTSPALRGSSSSINPCSGG